MIFANGNIQEGYWLHNRFFALGNIVYAQENAQGQGNLTYANNDSYSG